VIVGVAAVTVTVNEQVAVSPPDRVTEAVTVVVPIGNVDPEAGLEVTDAPAQSPPAIGEG